MNTLEQTPHLFNPCSTNEQDLLSWLLTGAFGQAYTGLNDYNQSALHRNAVRQPLGKIQNVDSS